MTKEQFRALKEGDIVRSEGGLGYIVTANYGDRVTAVRTMDMTNPDEWVLVLKANHRAPECEGRGGEEVSDPRVSDDEDYIIKLEADLERLRDAVEQWKVQYKGCNEERIAERDRANANWAEVERLRDELERLRAIIIGTDDVHAFYEDENIRIEAREIRRREGEK
jgi:hypothetical protein